VHADSFNNAVVFDGVFLRSYDVLTGTLARPANCAAAFGLTREDRQIADFVEVLQSGVLAELLAGTGAHLRIDPCEHISLCVPNASTSFDEPGPIATQSPAFECGDAHA
jgi:hypothetical protein